MFVIGIAWWHLGHTSRATEFTHLAPGGWIGACLSSGLRAMLGSVCSHIFLLFFTLGGIVWATDMRLLHLFDHAVAGGRRVTSPLTEGAKAGAAAVRERVQRKEPTSPAARVLLAQLHPTPKREEKEAEQTEIIPTPNLLALPFREGRRENAGVGSDDMPTLPRVSLSMPIVADKPKTPAGPLIIPDALGDDGTKHEYVLPPLELLNESPPKPVIAEKDAQENRLS